MDRGRMLEVIRAEGFAFPDESLIRLCNRMVVEGAMVDQAEKFFRDADLARIRELEAELDALRKQQGEPVAWITPLPHGSQVTFYKPSKPETWDDEQTWYCHPLYRKATQLTDGPAC